MNAVLRRCLTLALLLAALFMVAFAGMRLATPWLAGQRDAIETRVSKSLGRPVTIGAIDAEWRGLALDLRLRDVKVKNPGGKILLSFDEARFTPDLLDSVLRGRAKLSDLRVTGADVHLVRRADGTVIVRGLNRRQSSELDAAANLIASLRDSRIRWADRRLGVDYRFENVAATFDARGGQTRLRAKLALAGDRDSHIMLAANLRGRLARPDGLRGNFYARAQNLPLSRLPARLRAKVERGTAILEVWGSLRNGKLARVIGHADIDNAVVAGERRLAHVGTKFRWQEKARGWRLWLADLEVKSAGRGWQMAAANLDHRIARGGQTIYTGWLSNARVEDLLALVSGADSGELAQKLVARAPTGGLSETRFTLRLEDGEVEHYHASGQFRDLSLVAGPDTPGFAGADGCFSFSRKEGTLALRTRRLEIEHPRLFADTLRFDDLRGDVRWRRENGRIVIQSPELILSNEDFAARGPLELRVGAGAPYLDMQIALSRGNVAKAADYLPAKILSPRATEWLQQALVAGRLTAGEVRFRGQIADFPFRDGGGEFEARLAIGQGVLDYRSGWPRVEAAQAKVAFRGPSLSIDSAHARVLDSDIESAGVRIADLREGDLHVKLDGHGPLNDIARYLQRSILVESKVFERLTVAGDSRLALDLRLPLAKETDPKETDQKPRVSGRVQLDGASLRIAQPGLDFTDIEGELAFGPDGFRGEAISGRFRGRRVSADVAPAADRSTHVAVRGRLPARVLLAGFEHPALAQIQGQSDWRARLRLPAFKKAEPQDEPRPIRLSLASSLQGTAVELPQPLKKTAAERRPFRIVTAFGDARQHPVRVRYGRDISAVFALSKGPSGMRLARGELRVARGRAMLPRAGVTVKAALAEFSVTDWSPWLDAGNPMPSAGDGGSILRALDVTARHLQWSGRRFDNIRLVAVQKNARWAATIESAQIAGRISMPVDMNSGAPLVANLRHLYLETVNGATSVTDPRKLPPLRVTSQALRIDGFEFNDLYLETARLKTGMQVRKLELSAPDFKGQAQGRWRISEAGQHSSFDIALDSGDLGEILRRWDLQHGVRNGVARVEAHFVWPDAPSRFDLAGLEGRAQLRVEDGRLREINPGPGRLLGLINLDAISRRLSLDFSDLFRTGLSFDTMTGDLRFRGANMYTDNLVIDGPAAQIKITGRTGLVARDYDQRVVVVPKIMSGLPIAGALLGGPAVGAALFVAEKVFDELEDPGIDEADGILYTVTGPWETPRIKPAEPRARTAQPSKKFPYTIR